MSIFRDAEIPFQENMALADSVTAILPDLSCV